MMPVAAQAQATGVAVRNHALHTDHLRIIIARAPVSQVTTHIAQPKGFPHAHHWHPPVPAALIMYMVKALGVAVRSHALQTIHLHILIAPTSVAQVLPLIAQLEGVPCAHQIHPPVLAALHMAQAPGAAARNHVLHTDHLHMIVARAAVSQVPPLIAQLKGFLRAHY